MSVPYIIAVFIFLSGLINIISGLFLYDPFRLSFIEELFPFQVIHLSRTLVIIAGLFLIFLARGIWLRKKRSWWLSMGIIITSVFLHVMKGLDYEESILLIFILAALWKYKRLFTVESDRYGYLKSFKIVLVILLITFIYAFFGFYVFQGQFSSLVTIGNITRDYLYSIFGVGADILIPETRRAVWFENSISTVGILSFIYMFAAVFAPLVQKEKPTEEQRKLARKIMAEHAINSVSYFGLMSDKLLFFNRNQSGVVAYKIANGVAVVLGDPVGERGEDESTLQEFTQEMEKRGLSYIFYNTINNSAYKKLGMKLIKIGEEAIITCGDFSLDKPEMKDVRYGVNKIRKMNMRLCWYALDEIPWRVMADVDKLYANWLTGKKIPSLTFSLGFYPLPVEEKADLLCVYARENSLQAAFSFLPYGKKNMAMDLMLRADNAPNGMAEGAIAAAILHFRELGYKQVSLGMAPRYGYKSLGNFKNKFLPTWEHKYLAYRKSREFPQITMALARVHMVVGN